MPMWSGSKFLLKDLCHKIYIYFNNLENISVFSGSTDSFKTSIKKNSFLVLAVIEAGSPLWGGKVLATVPLGLGPSWWEDKSHQGLPNRYPIHPNNHFLIILSSSAARADSRIDSVSTLRLKTAPAQPRSRGCLQRPLGRLGPTYDTPASNLYLHTSSVPPPTCCFNPKGGPRIPSKSK